MLTRYGLHPTARAALRSHFYRSFSVLPDTSNNVAGHSVGQHNDDKSTKLVKRKVAIVGGFMGKGFHGLQLNDNVYTIEDEIRRAILQAGAMRDSNFEHLSKIDWARSSRTDKGVHAGCIVFSGKLLIDEENRVDPVSGRVHCLKEALNASLPDNIRVFSCTRVNKRFSARKNCVLREYEYFMPLSFVKGSIIKATNGDFDPDQAVTEFCHALRRYEGVHDFHNFTRSRSYFYKIQAKKTQNERLLNEIKSLDDVMDDDTESENSAVEGNSEEINQLSDIEGYTRKQLFRHRRSIYSCTGSVVSNFDSEPYLRVRIVGQAFLLNQIRCMIGAALAVATKGMSWSEFDAALLTNRIVRVPIAPAEGLVLLSSSFGGRLHTVSLYNDSNTPLAKERIGVMHRVLLDHNEDEEMKNFREEVIYKQVAQSWNMEMDRWRTYLERCYEANEHLNEDELCQLLHEQDQSKLAHKHKNKTFLEYNRVKLTEIGRQGALLPKQFTTKLCIRYNVAPGIFTTDLRRAIAHHLKAGKIPHDADEEQIMAYIDSCGPKTLAKEGRYVRLNIQT
ncbi:trna pseudouridine(38-40) synthase [Plasmopara halstedii]|uniref:Trna pseudouridine(38-40) synthase n=1 Tax=Plasmopara halstedii TaxID=4781 RepID=A0A0P1AIJ4_PLAHL|nr:trna pseudouridine(38-40) synthase [Plasmopara halstedii]CEG40732.1 trna pseudouridine(38-40) synthase [Plasmopara halstedii]|eukprot:XP_024577101.1 trna pseudouridine(38-40) synthase [Plasmopara halstedii]